MKIAVTGANGFLGSHIVRYLVRKGYHVYALVRPGSSTKFIKKSKAEIIETNYFGDDQHLLSIFQQVDFIVHNAALAKDWGKKKSDFIQTNVTLVKHIYDLADKSGVKNIVHISSTAVIGEEDCTTPKSEDSVYNPEILFLFERVFPSEMNYYRVTKMEGERWAIKYAEDRNLNLTVFRPAWIFGPREFHAGPYEYCKTVKSKVPFLPGTKKNLFHVVYVEDVARAVYMAIEKRLPNINIFNIGSAKVPTMHEFYDCFCKHLGVRKPINIPQFVLYPFVFVLELIYAVLKASNPPLLTRARLYMLYASNVYKTDKAKSILGFSADTDLSKAVEKTLRWWKQNGYI